MQQAGNESSSRADSLAGCLFGFFFQDEDGGDTFLRNVGKFLLDYTMSHPRGHYKTTGGFRHYQRHSFNKLGHF
jgi:hypothetical protein